VSGSGISWAVCKSAPRSRQITMPVPYQATTKGFYRPDALPAAQPTASKHWRTLRGMYTTLLILHPPNGLFSKTTGFQKGKTSRDLNEARDDWVLGWQWHQLDCVQESAPRSRQITTPTPHHSIFTGWTLFLMPKQQCQSTGGHLYGT